jgi:hypothetical protein
MMCHATDNPNSSRICTVICFLDTKHMSSAEIHYDFCTVYGQNGMSEGNVKQ